jgi:hypothetical protein
MHASPHESEVLPLSSISLDPEAALKAMGYMEVEQLESFRKSKETGTKQDQLVSQEQSQEVRDALNSIPPKTYTGEYRGASDGQN